MILKNDPVSPVRHCTDEEYGLQQRCYHCDKYSFKSWASEDHNRGKCFAIGLESRVRYVDGNDICNQFQYDGVQNEE